MLTLYISLAMLGSAITGAAIVALVMLSDPTRSPRAMRDATMRLYRRDKLRRIRRRYS